MTPVARPTTDGTARLGAEARSILACPAAVNLVVDGVDDVLAGMHDLGDGLGMADLAGEPTFTCLPDTPLARAAAARHSALLTLESGLGSPGSVDRGATLTLAGRLEPGPTEGCDCCGETRQVIRFTLNFVLLSRTDAESGHPSEQLRVPLAAFRSPAHHLNRGFLQRSAEHATTCHQDELRRAVSNLTQTRLAEVVGVSLTDLQPHRVDVQWVGVEGAHSQTLTFPQPATTTDELGELLRRELHAGLC